MKRYIDGFLLCVPKKNLKVYQKIAGSAGNVWMEHGALQYVETVGDDLSASGGLPFPEIVKPKNGEVIVFSWIMYKSKAHRNQVNKKVMKDKRIMKWMDKPMPFDMKRMAYGGFVTIVNKGQF